MVVCLQSLAQQPRWPTVREFLRYQRNKIFVTLRRLSEPKVTSPQSFQHLCWIA